jgi:hypothetical protein
MFRRCLSLLLVWTLICGIAAPRVDAAGIWLIELSTALLSTPNTEQRDTPTDAVISRTRPTLNSGRIEGNLRVLKAEPFSIGAQTTLNGDLFLAGSASIQSSEAVLDDGGPTSPAYAVSISGVSGKIHAHTQPITLPADFPSTVPPPTGLRTITIRTKSDVAAIGDWQTVRDLNVTRAGLSIDVPPGNYGTFTVNGNSRLNFTAGTYNFANTFNLDGSASLQATGNVTINVAQNLTINSGAIVLGSS